MKEAPQALIITRSLVLQQGLGALLESFPGISDVKAIKDLPNAYAWIETQQPKIVFLDVAILGRDVPMVLEKLRMLSPKTQRVLLVDHVEDIRWVPQYAEAIVIKGESPSAVAGIVTHLLFPKGEKDEHSDPNV